ncbi:MAG: three-Cys-motif partner protein TcmP [Chloroflexi bacterium]|nr:three-Cys-motif partner protein TcmP [Chloroflexota bacterium]
MKRLKYDEVGYWTEIKLDIIKEYAAAYTTIMANQHDPSFTYIYIDAFAGAGQHISKRTGEFIPGSPRNALNIKNPFHEYHYVDLEDAKVAELESLVGERDNVFIYHGDCNQVLPKQILPRVDFKKYWRALCILDPYGLHLNWEIIQTAGRMGSVEIFLNFPVMDINMNVLKHDQTKVAPEQIDRMNAYWGGDSWRQEAYVKSRQHLLPGFGEAPDEKTPNQVIEAAFRERLKNVAGFKYVPEPMPMRNSNNAIVYYLYFASQKPVARDIVESIFAKYSQRRTD